jgi:hypothetical protein
MRHLHLVHPASAPPEVDNGLKNSTERSMTTQCAAMSEGKQPIERDGRPFEPDVQALLQHVRIIGPLPRAVRERALARARAALAAPACVMARPSYRPRRPWLTLVVSVVLAAAVGAAVEAFLARSFADTEPPSHAAAPLQIAAD